jgi:dipeptidyl aminopeptidase/acylaminoacyl peptidase
VLSRGYDEHATWSPDGRRLAFAHDRTGNGDTSIWTMNDDGSERLKLTNPSGDDADHKPVWSPNGTSIAFERPYDVWIVDVRTGREQLLAKFAELLAWASEGRYLLVQKIKRERRKSGLYSVPVDGTSKPRLIARGVGWTEACWSKAPPVAAD